jgi:hypothetical protein
MLSVSVESSFRRPPGGALLQAPTLGHHCHARLRFAAGASLGLRPFTPGFAEGTNLSLREVAHLKRLHAQTLEATMTSTRNSIGSGMST